MTPDEVWMITVRPPFSGATAEGYRLGDSEAAFETLYRDLLGSSADHQKVVLDQNGTNLIAYFNDNGAAIWLSLTNTRCYTCDPLTGTPGPKKKGP